MRGGAGEGSAALERKEDRPGLEGLQSRGGERGEMWTLSAREWVPETARRGERDGGHFDP